MNQLAKYIIGIAAALIVGFIAWYFSNILIYILISAVLSLIGKPLMTKLCSLKFKKWHIPKNIAALITLLAIILVFSSFFIFVAPLAGNLFSSINAIDFANLSNAISQPLADINSTIHKWFPTLDSTYRIENVMIDQFRGLLDTTFVTSIVTSITSMVIDFGVALFIIGFITYFFIKEQNMFNNMVTALFPDKYEENIKRALESINSLLVRYFIGISIETVAITFLNGFGLYLIAGVDFSLAFVLAFISGVLNVIPYIGPITGGIFGVLMSAVDRGFADPQIGNLIITAAIVFFITHMIDLFIFQPNIYSKSVKAHPLEIFLVILIAGSIAGIVGMLVAIPSYTVIRVFAREFLSKFKVVKKLTVNI